MSLLVKDFRHALLALGRSPGFALLAVATLALGIGATTAIFSQVDAVLFRPLPVRDPDRLARVFARVEGSADLSNSSYPVYTDYRDGARSFTSLAAYADFIPINLEIPGRAAERLTSAVVTGNYFETLGVRAAAGRLLQTSDDGPPGLQPVLVVSERLWRSRMGANTDAAGRSVRVNGHPFRIVGVAPAGFFGAGLDSLPDAWIPMGMAPPLAELYVPAEQVPWDEMAVLVRSKGDPIRLAPAVRSKIRSLDPKLPVEEVQALSEIVARSLGQRRFAMLLLGTFAGLALLLAAVGIYGVVAFLAGQRVREVGIRIALGARRRDVLALFLGESARFAGAGLLAGLALAIAATRLLKTMLFGVAPTDPLSFAAVAFVLTAVAMAASWIPARRAARIDPMEALRNE